jgi:hypothetical protein
MGQKIKIDDSEYDVDKISDEARKHLIALQFTTNKLQELKNMQALLTRAKNSYMETIKKEILSEKAGFLLNDD